MKEALDPEAARPQKTVRGEILGVDEEGVIQVKNAQGEVKFPFDSILSGRLVFVWGKSPGLDPQGSAVLLNDGGVGPEVNKPARNQPSTQTSKKRKRKPN